MVLSLGVRPWRGAEVYVNPEMALGLPLSGLVGLGGFPNAELARTAGRDPVFYLARGFLRQTIGLGGGASSMSATSERATLPSEVADSVKYRSTALELTMFGIDRILSSSAHFITQISTNSFRSSACRRWCASSAG